MECFGAAGVVEVVKDGADLGQEVVALPEYVDQLRVADVSGAKRR